MTDRIPEPHDTVDIRALVLDVHDRHGRPWALVDLGRDTVNVWVPTRRMGVLRLNDPDGESWDQYVQLFSAGPLLPGERAEAVAVHRLIPEAYPPRTVRALCQALRHAMAAGRAGR